MSSPFIASPSTQPGPGHLPELPPLAPPASPSAPTPTPQLPSMLVYVKERVKAGWEYKMLVRNLAKESAPTEVDLNPLGDAGWELTGIASDSPLLYFYFKRPAK